MYSRLNIPGLLSKVLLRPGANIKDFHPVTVEDEMPPRKRLRGAAPTAEVKQEKSVQDMMRAAVMQALSHCSHQVILQELEVPWAVVKILGGATVPPQSGGSGELAKQKIDITVSSDDLLPVPHGGYRGVERDPTLMREDHAYEVIKTYPLDTHNLPLWDATAKYALRASFMLGCAGLDEVKVLRMSKEKPWLFQVRSQKAFSKKRARPHALRRTLS